MDSKKRKYNFLSIKLLFQDISKKQRALNRLSLTSELPPKGADVRENHTLESCKDFHNEHEDALAKTNSKC